MTNYKYLLIAITVVFVVGSTFSVLFLFGSNKNTTSVEVASPFVDSFMPDPTTTPTPTPEVLEEEEEKSEEKKETRPETVIINKTDNSSAEEIESLQSKIETLEERIAKLEETSSTNTSSTTTIINESSSKVKEYYIYLGSGSTTNRDWTEINSSSAFIDTNNYGNIKDAYFEGALSIVGGEVHARLKNKSSNTIIYNSEISHNTNSSSWEKSLISLNSGNVEYVVELKSTSGEKANLDGARIKIVVE